MTTAGEIERALNALATTLGDQRPERVDHARLQQIVDGSLGGSRKLLVHGRGATHAEVVDAEAGKTIAVVALENGRWDVSRT
jgi:hypothetical protein